MKYEIAHLIGSTENNEERFRIAKITLTKMGYICFRPVIYNLTTYLSCKDLIDDMCKEKLLLCDICVIVTPEKIGESTKQMIQQAIELGKPVYKFTRGILQLFQEEELDSTVIKFKPLEIDSMDTASNLIKLYTEKLDEINLDTMVLIITLQKTRSDPPFRKGKFLVDLDSDKVIQMESEEKENEQNETNHCCIA